MQALKKAVSKVAPSVFISNYLSKLIRIPTDVKYHHKRFSSRLDEFMRISHAVGLLGWYWYIVRIILYMATYAG